MRASHCLALTSLALALGTLSCGDSGGLPTTPRDMSTPDLTVPPDLYMKPPKQIYCTQKPDDCQPMIDLQTFSGMDRFCHVDADCTRNAPNNQQLTQCCTLTQNGQAVHVCLNQMLAGFSQGAATCP